jgi:hypothetical protein
MQQKEPLDNPWIFGLVIFAMGVGLALPVFKLMYVKSKKQEVSSGVKEHEDFKLPDFHVNDCFLVSKKGESLHPHYIKILEKDNINKRFEVLEVIGNGQNQEVNIRVNYYGEMKSFANYRETCPKFLVK